MKKKELGLEGPIFGQKEKFKHRKTFVSFFCSPFITFILRCCIKNQNNDALKNEGRNNLPNSKTKMTTNLKSTLKMKKNPKIKRTPKKEDTTKKEDIATNKEDQKKKITKIWSQPQRWPWNNDNPKNQDNSETNYNSKENATLFVLT